MPRYFFHVVGHQGFSGPDLEGLELPNLTAAREEAQHFVTELLHDAANEGVEFRETIEVTDDKGELLLRYGFAGVEEVKALKQIPSVRVI